MTAERNSDEHERAAAGLDFDEHSGMRDGAARLGAKMHEDPGAILDEIENLLPEAWRDQIKTYPVAAVLIGLGVGVWLGMKKSDEIMSAGSSLISAAAMANVSDIMDRVKGER
jgi:hypothetical protein